MKDILILRKGKTSCRTLYNQYRGMGDTKDVEAALEAYKDKVIYINKITFGSTELSEIIKELGTENEELTVDFVGVCTGICIISNAIISKAFAPGADIRVIESACACVTPDSHKMQLKQ